jgi:hypothetical protein
LSLYAQSNDGLKSEFKEKTKKRFRKNILEYLKKDYQFFSLQLKPSADSEGWDEDENLDAMHKAINKHFRGSIGKVFRPYSDEKFMYVGLENKDAFYEENHALLAELSEDFIIRHYTLDTNPTAELNRLYELEKELDSGVEDNNLIQLEELSNEVFLIGGWRREKNQLDWILHNNMYNIRKTKRGTQRSGARGVDEDVVSAKYLLLYEIGDDSYRYDVYRLDGHKERTAGQMLKKGYIEPTGNYIVYNLKMMPRNIVPLDIKSIIDSVYLEELEKRRREGNAEEGWEEKWKGTPIFKRGNELMAFKK